MTSDQRPSGSGRGYIEQRHLPQEGMDYDPVVDRARNLRPLVAQEGSYAYQTSSGHGTQHAQLSITSTLLAPRLGLWTCRQ